MTKQIAVAGKGGTGKTTFTALMVRYLLEKRAGKSILAVDADANANLNEALGLEVNMTISSILEDTKKTDAIPTGMTKDVYMQYKLNQSLTETDRLDLLVMGNPEGPGCYCYPNDLLKRYLEQLRGGYDYVVIDNEAGLEHISRRIIDDIDTMIVTTDSSVRGVRSAGRIKEIITDLKIDVKHIYLIISRAQGDEEERLKEEINKTGLELLGSIPADPKITRFDMEGKALFNLPETSAALKAVYSLCARMSL